MSKQDKATTERNAKTLREMVKRPGNKVCADCKHPRWASWNIGVFICIRCSGIHRSMGTHISKVKSVDLDVWTPEQMQSIEKWGNERANRYWEMHLKPGHIPLDHKMESFIRSKYESRRWAMDGTPPEDPSVLDSSDQSSKPPVRRISMASEPPVKQEPTQDLTTNAPPSSAKPPRQHTLLSTAIRSKPVQGAPVAPAPPTTAVTSPPVRDDIFSLDFTPPSSNPPAPTPKSDVKNDIMSLFSSSAAAPTVSVPQQQTSLVGHTGVGHWGVQSGWSAQPPGAAPNPWGSFSSQPQLATTTIPASTPATSIPNTTSQNIWASPQQQPLQQSNDLFGSNITSFKQTKKDDAFGDIWGGFK
ncbi:uncharacterized protein EI90DRAFT_2922255 [Cantharellus anzutake]|uniref:uncharacterized protein n=1 Tax=Cantharellus anzutake TaxID=1750568 RepID=UPI001904571F|nr:uncharacterized protein EI90DRAFT_2922255 [Cantharellus anzutake]KAF8330444.1 hypothetical protein EI90DRAFT_2922255 [Cantharellus anzutake]